MNKGNELTKALISPPGDTLKEHLDFIGMKPGDLAEHINVTNETIHDLICGREQISDDIATKLENVLHIPSSFWLKREKEYRQELLDSGVGV